MQWQLLISFPDGHRFFRDVESDDQVAIGDQSGSTPDQTDDGTLWLDQNDRRVHGSYERGGIHLRVEVFNDIGTRRSWVQVTMDEALWLAEHLDYDIIVTNARGTQKAKIIPI